jgi:drug/metabolite transporter (DMT)-like permease
MSWFYLALLVIFLNGAESILNRFFLKKEKDSNAYALLFHIIGIILFLFLFAIEWNLPSKPEAWLIAIVAAILWTAIAVISFKACRVADVSLKTPIARSKIFWALLFAAIIIGETITLDKIIGSILIFIGILIVSVDLNKKFGGFNDPGVKLTLLFAFLMGIVVVIDKLAMNYFQPSIYGFLQYLLPGIFLFAAIPNRINRMKKLVKRNGILLIITGMLVPIGYWILLKVYQTAEVSSVIPVLESSVIISMLGGIIFLGERKDLIRRALGAIIVLIGVLIIKGAIIW